MDRWNSRPRASGSPEALLLLLLASYLALSSGQEDVPTPKNPNWPRYKRGKDQYQWALSRPDRENGITFVGSNHRLRNVVHKMLDGQTVRITALGGSITAGDMQYDGHSWPQYVYNYLNDQYGNTVQGTNGAVGGTRSSYVSVCHNMHVPKDVDVVMLEFAVNDGNNVDAALMRAQERLVRKLLNYPNKPAVIAVHTLTWWAKDVGNWESGTEVSYNEFATYYGMQSVSHRSCCMAKLLASEPGFHTELMRGQNREENAGVSFYHDPAHLDGLTGARTLAEMVMHLFDLTAQDVHARPVTPEEAQQVASSPLPSPLLPGNYESVADRCLMGGLFKDSLGQADGFEWINESKGARARWGMVATKPGSTVQFAVDSRATLLGQGEEVAVLIAFLMSYEHMGRATITCASGCTCAESQFDGHTNEENSQTALHRVAVTQHAKCVLQARVLEETTSGEHKVKLLGVMVSEEAGSQAIVLTNHQGAFERVSNGASDNGGVFNHVRAITAKGCAGGVCAPVLVGTTPLAGLLCSQGRKLKQDGVRS